MLLAFRVYVKRLKLFPQLGHSKSSMQNAEFSIFRLDSDIDLPHLGQLTITETLFKKGDREKIKKFVVSPKQPQTHLHTPPQNHPYLQASTDHNPTKIAVLPHKNAASPTKQPGKN